jgi:hypothetical protein
VICLPARPGPARPGPVREREQTLIADLDLRTVTPQRLSTAARYYDWPDVFRLLIDTAPCRRSSRSGWGAKVSPTS